MAVLAQIIEQRQSDQYALHRQYLNTSLARVQAIIGFDKIYTRGEGAYPWDAEGHRYLDLLAGYSVHNLGRNHPLVKEVMQEVLTMDRPWTGPTWSRWTAPIAGQVHLDFHVIMGPLPDEVGAPWSPRSRWLALQSISPIWTIRAGSTNVTSFWTSWSWPSVLR